VILPTLAGIPAEVSIIKQKDNDVTACCKSDQGVILPFQCKKMHQYAHTTPLKKIISTVIPTLFP
jgi:hypothetical protein